MTAISQSLGHYVQNKCNVDLLSDAIVDAHNRTGIDCDELLCNCVGVILKHSVQDAYDYITEINEYADLYSTSEFDHAKQLHEEEQLYLTKPIEVEEGVNVCNKCGSNRCMSYSKQTRSSDEGTTVFCMCAKCGAVWKM